MLGVFQPFNPVQYWSSRPTVGFLLSVRSWESIFKNIFIDSSVVFVLIISHTFWSCFYNTVYMYRKCNMWPWHDLSINTVCLIIKLEPLYIIYTSIDQSSNQGPHIDLWSYILTSMFKGNVFVICTSWLLHHSPLVF